ncbi:MAG: kynurenine 3-monooxygenase [Crocinitomicaceae bacterium]|nr:kynurenine 3-monooxygenase [Crocinitomicaceae bacterium]|tara:strand:- start:616 stop:2049 length:1434 start_codon:yes stop_codon:yes gene_type:complete
MKTGIQNQEHHAVVGAGLVGSLLGLMLAQRGYKVTIYDRRSDPRKGKAIEGRSINLALSDRGWRALEKAGLADKVREIALPIKGRRMHDHSGNETFQAYGVGNQCIYSVSRSGLNLILVTAAEAHPSLEVKFDFISTGYTIENQDGVSGVTLNFKNKPDVLHDRIFGADGAFSAIRGKMTRTNRFDFSQQYLPHGYKEIFMSANSQGGFRISEDGLHIWPRGNFMLMALPNPGGTFTCTLFAPFEGDESFDNIKSNGDVMAFFKRHFPDAIQHLPNLIDDWNSNPVSSLCTVKCHPWNIKSRVVIIGDAAHAMVPFFGQGMNSGFEDCTILSSLIDESQPNSEAEWHSLLDKYTRVRKPAGDAILDLALHNYIVMRDKTGDPDYLIQKRIEARIAAVHPDRWKPLYSLVTFSHIPYAEAWSRGEIQQAVMNEIMATHDISENWEKDEIVAQAIKLLDAFESGTDTIDRPLPLLSTDV